MNITAYVLTYNDQPVRVGSYSQATISNAPSVFYSKTAAAYRAGQGHWVGKTTTRIPPNTLKIKEVRVVDS